jgi:hypothetical protein
MTPLNLAGVSRWQRGCPERSRLPIVVPTRRIFGCDGQHDPDGDEFSIPPKLFERDAVTLSCVLGIPSRQGRLRS